MKTLIRYPVMLLIATLGLAACGSNGDHAGMPGMGDQSRSTADVQFAQMMIPHHAQAVVMAELAQTRATDPELRQLAAAIKAAQQPEIDLMTGHTFAVGGAAGPRRDTRDRLARADVADVLRRGQSRALGDPLPQHLSRGGGDDDLDEVPGRLIPPGGNGVVWRGDDRTDDGTTPD